VGAKIFYLLPSSLKPLWQLPPLEKPCTYLLPPLLFLRLAEWGGIAEDLFFSSRAAKCAALFPGSRQGIQKVGRSLFPSAHRSMRQVRFLLFSPPPKKEPVFPFPPLLLSSGKQIYRTVLQVFLFSLSGWELRKLGERRRHFLPFSSPFPTTGVKKQPFFFLFSFLLRTLSQMQAR